MHRRMRLGLGSTLLLLMFLAGPGTAFAGPLAESEQKEAVGGFDLLSWAWEWFTSLASGALSGSPEGGPLSSLNGGDGDGGPFTDPNGRD